MRSDVLSCLTAMERTPEGYAATFTFGAELDVFSGHFPGYPLVPGPAGQVLVLGFLEFPPGDGILFA